MTNASTTLFEWAKDQGLSIEALADRLGYSARHLYRIQAGVQPVTDAFVGRVVLRLGEWARSLFLVTVSENSDTTMDSPDIGSDAA